MTIHTTAHLNFRGDARAALEFYQGVFGGQLVAVSYADAHRVTEPTEADQIVFGSVISDNGFRIMAYDVPSEKAHAPGTIPLYVSVRGADPAEIVGYWEKLAEGSSVLEPLATSQWSPLYGMLTDPFGVTWVLDVEVQWSAA
ncbi:VOC family protein [Cryobacterium adonitolivorans]|uniref:VOC family protein n=1 Tax=Cryobacterium adonitolivorans TaxID=1259189 RepID=A0A4R8VY89_9MICO|nr:VOC family protein [Cryobacterium adonitolivorans]TFB97498.1 VOC family protein [Cryobacterium adonitolivorans]